MKLFGEDAIDAGGPYHEILSDICKDLESDYIELFIKTPNNKNNLGEHKDGYMLNPNCKSIIHKNAFEFIGKLMVLAISSGETLNLDLHPVIWKSLIGKQITLKDYEEIDKCFYNMIENIKKDKTSIGQFSTFIITNSNGEEIELKENGKNIDVTMDNVDEFIELAQKTRLEEISEQLECIKRSLYSVFGKNTLKILSWNQLELLVCGEIEFNVEDFKKHTRCNNEENIIKFFWEWLEGCSKEEKVKYLNFVSGRLRLPSSDYEHCIIIINNKDKLPYSRTCFFTLYLPRYDSVEILRKKMKIVFENAGNIMTES